MHLEGETLQILIKVKKWVANFKLTQKYFLIFLCFSKLSKFFLSKLRFFEIFSNQELLDSLKTFLNSRKIFFKNFKVLEHVRENTRGGIKYV